MTTWRQSSAKRLNGRITRVSPGWTYPTLPRMYQMRQEQKPAFADDVLEDVPAKDGEWLTMVGRLA
jgi:hypothetical protein